MVLAVQESSGVVFASCILVLLSSFLVGLLSYLWISCHSRPHVRWTDYLELVRSCFFLESLAQ